MFTKKLILTIIIFICSNMLNVFSQNEGSYNLKIAAEKTNSDSLFYIKVELENNTLEKIELRKPMLFSKQSVKLPFDWDLSISSECDGICYLSTYFTNISWTIPYSKKDFEVIIDAKGKKIFLIPVETYEFMCMNDKGMKIGKRKGIFKISLSVTFLSPEDITVKSNEIELSL